MPIKCLKAVNIYPNIVLCFIEILKIWLPLKELLILKSKKAHIKKMVTPKWVSDMFSSLFYLDQCSLIFQFELCTFCLLSIYILCGWVCVCYNIGYIMSTIYISIMSKVLKKMIGNWFRELFHISQANVWVSRHSNSFFPYESWLQKIVQERRMQMRIWNKNF